MWLDKLLKWSASAMRVAAAKIRLGCRLRLPLGGKPVYLGRGARLVVADGAWLRLGRGAYVDDRSRLQVSAGASMAIGDGCYLNTNCRIVAADSVTIGARTMLGPNVCVYDHDHAFGNNGVSSDLVTAPVEIGERCWIGANALVTKGVSISDRICLGGGPSRRAPWRSPASTWALRRGLCGASRLRAVA